MIDYKCPCCGQSMGSVLDPTKIPMSPVRKTIVKALPGTIEDIAEAVYGTRANTPTEQYQSLRVMLVNVRKLLEPHGWTINNDRSGRGNSKTYHLVRLA